MIDSERGLPLICAVAVTAGRRCLDVGRALASGNRTVVTSGAATAYLGMVDHIRRRPYDSIVAGLAGIGCLNMGRDLAGGLGAVVTIDTIAADVDMVEVCRDPAVGRMAVTAGITAVDVSRVLTSGNSAVMAGCTGADDLRVVYSNCRSESRGVVAGFAHIRCLNMCEVFANCSCAIVAANAIIGNSFVIECGR